MGTVFQLHADERELFAVDFAGLLEAGETITLEELEIRAHPAGTDATLDFGATGAVVDGAQVKLWLAPPDGRARYRVYCRVTTSTGRELVGTPLVDVAG